MGNIAQVINAPNEYRIMHAQWEASNTLRDARNTREASDVALKEFTRTLNNNRRIDAAGKEYNRQVTNLAHVLDTTTKTNLNLQMAAATIHGSLAAQAAAAGVGGSTVDLLDAATDLQRDIKIDANNEARKGAAWAGSEQASDTIDSAYSGIDNSRFFGNFDHSTAIEPTPLKNRVGTIIGSAFAAFLGGPNASNAAAGVTLANWKAQNGQYEDANRYYTQAGQDAAAAYRDWKSVQDGDGVKAWGTAVFAKATDAQTAVDKSEEASKNLQQWKSGTTEGGGGFSWFNLN